jgi:hypothetical protein
LADKKITQIIIYYSNNTFDTFIPHKVKEWKSEKPVFPLLLIDHHLLFI